MVTRDSVCSGTEFDSERDTINSDKDMETKFSLCDDLVFFNTTSCKFEKVHVKGIQIIPSGISKDSEGKDVLDGHVVLYQTKEGMVLSESELFVDERSAIDHYRSVLEAL